MATLLNDTVNDVRRISSDLRPGILDDAGLVAAIEWQLDRFRERSSIDCGLEASADDSVLDRPRATALFRVFQELLTNVARHAGATQVRVAFECDSNVCSLSVSDDGRGITGEQASSTASLGIIGVRERLRPLGGDIEFIKRSPKGTTAKVTVPIGKVNHHAS
jgi:signal transduction histidine kinase